MPWVSTGVVVVVVAAVGLYLLLGVTIFVTHLIEKRPFRFLTPAPDDDPGWSKIPDRAPKLEATPEAFNPYQSPGSAEYTETSNAAAARLGIAFHGLHVPVKGRIYQTRTALWVSPTRQILAVVGWGKSAAITEEKTILYTALDDGRFLVTSDKPTGAETPGLYENLYVLGADFDSLVRRHEARIYQSGRGVHLFMA
jgi:hypothetical protein